MTNRAELEHSGNYYSPEEFIKNMVGTYWQVAHDLDDKEVWGWRADQLRGMFDCVLWCTGPSNWRDEVLESLSFLREIATVQSK